MDLELSDDQSELAAIARQLLDERAPLSLARAYLEGEGEQAPLWQSIAESGWYAVGLDADDPFGIPGLCLLSRECGAHAAPALLVDTAVSARLAGLTAEAGRPGSALAALAAGDRVAALAVLEAGADWSLGNLATEAVAAASGGFLLNGVKLGVHHAASADALAVLAAVDGGLGVFFVTTGQQGVAVAPQLGLDPTTAPATVTFSDVHVDSGACLTGAEAVAAVEQVFAIGAVATAAEAIGAASKALDMAIEYSLERYQFGRPIGQFQALQHLMADGHILRETSWSTVLYAAAALSEGTADAMEAASIAKSHVSRASRATVEIALQVFGGIAFTWEHDVHLLQRRVLECERRFGDAIHHERLLIERLVTKESVLA